MKNRFHHLSLTTLLLIIPVFAVLFLLVPAAEEILSAWLSPWKSLPTPPSRPVELLGTGGGVGPSIYTIQTAEGQKYMIGDLFFLAEDGRVYSYEQYDGSLRSSQAEMVQNRETCDRYGPWFSQKNGECVQGADWESPGVMHRFLLDSQGILWHWVDQAPIFPSFLFCGLSGLAVGCVVFLIMFFSKRRQINNEKV